MEWVSCLVSERVLVPISMCWICCEIVCRVVFTQQPPLSRFQAEMRCGKIGDGIFVLKRDIFEITHVSTDVYTRYHLVFSKVILV